MLLKNISSIIKNRELRRIFGPKRNKVTWEWKRLCNEELK
jgi:hypothetical protein